MKRIGLTWVLVLGCLLGTARAWAQDVPGADAPQAPHQPTMPAEPPPVQAEPTSPPVAPTPAPTPVVDGPRSQAPVSFRAGRITSEMIEGERVTVLTGDVYLTQAALAVGLGLELAAQTAVLFTEPLPEATAEMDLPEAPPPLLGPVLGGRERVVGAYLEGDVVMNVGARQVRAARLYYDFVNHRAIMLDVVLRTVQEARGVPIIVRAAEARQVSRRDVRFSQARVTSSEFHTPSFHIGASQARLEDITPRDDQEEPIGDLRYRVEMHNTTFNVRGVPVLWWPYAAFDDQTTDLPFRSFRVGREGPLGYGVETEWWLFRILGLSQPEGYRGLLRADIYQHGIGGGPELTYARDSFVGYVLAYGLRDSGALRPAIDPDYTGRLLWRHKQFLEDNWELQAELSYVCDEAFLERFYRSEYWTGKEQETLLYARKQEANWAFTSLLQTQLSPWQAGPEAAPDLGFWWIAQPVLDRRFTFYSESHLGLVRFEGADVLPSSDWGPRADTRAELTWPLRWGPVNVQPFVMGRGSWWHDAIDESNLIRWIGGAGIRANMHLWRVYPDVRNRLLDLHRLRHVITPELRVFAAASTHGPEELYPITPGIEQHVDGFQGVWVGVRQRWQTYRGPQGGRFATDFARLDVGAMIFNDAKSPTRPDGRFYFDRPEYSITRNALRGDAVVNLSDTLAVLADASYDLNDRSLDIANLAIAVQRDPRLRYFVGARYTDPLDTAVGTLGFNYVINRKYQVGLFQQYDFRFEDGRNLATRVSLVRRFPRWFAAITYMHYATLDDWAVVLTIWPEGLPEFRLGNLRFTPETFSDRN